MANRMVLVIPYFGHVPWYFTFFNQSCRYNPDVDFILITDMDVADGQPQGLAANVRLIRSSLEELSGRFTERLGFAVSIGRPYKICDLRPAFGLVFADYLEGYDFWGYCDIDVVFGNIRSFMTEDILGRHDVVTISEIAIAGPFTLFRNNEFINHLFERSKDHQRVFQSPLSYDFDECNWEWPVLNAGKDILELESEVVSITHVIRQAERAGEIRVYWHPLEHKPGAIVWEGGIMTDRRTGSAFLCHLCNFKKRGFTYLPRWDVIPERFFMNSFYFSAYAPGSLGDWGLRCALAPVRLLTGIRRKMMQQVKWVINYLFASRRINVEEIGQPGRLAGKYQSEKLMVDIVVIGECLHAKVGGSPNLRLLHKGAGRFVLARRRLYDLVNVELDFQFNGYDPVNMLEVSASGGSKMAFYRIG